MLLGHGWLRLELIMDGLDDGGQSGRVAVPAAQGRSLVLDGDWVKRWVRHRGHHMHFGWNLRELVRQSDLDEERSWRDIELQRHSVLRICGRLPEKQSVWVHLAKLVQLNVGHRCIHLLASATLHLLLLLACEQLVVGASLWIPHLDCRSQSLI